MPHDGDYPDPSPSAQTPYPALAFSQDGPTDESGLNELLSRYTSNASQYFSQEAASGPGTSYFWPGSRNNGETRDLLEVEPEPEPVLEGQLLTHHLLNRQQVLSSEDEIEYEDEDSSDEESTADSLVVTNLVQSTAPSRGGTSNRGRGRGRGGRRGGYKQLLKGTEHENVGTNRKGKELAHRSGPRPYRARKVPDPGPEFKDLMGRAMSTRLDGRLEEASELARAAIQANPEVFSAHFLLSEILTGVGRHVDSLIVYVNGCNTTRDPDAWLSAGHRAWEFADTEPERYSYLQLAKYCFDYCVKYRFNDTIARGRRLDFWLEVGPEHKARKEAKGLARENPFNLDFVRLYAELCTRSEDKVEIDKAKIVYERALDHYHTQYADFPQPEESWSFLHIYLELAENSGSRTWADSIKRLKRYARWFLGRKDEEFWEDWEDDREFDCDPQRRGQEVPEFQQGRANLDRMTYGAGLPIEIRAKFLVLRLNMGFGWNEEVERHVQEFMNFPEEEVDDFADIYLVVANKLVAHRYFDHAIKIAELLVGIPGQINDDLLMCLGHCYRNTNRMEEAEKYLKIVMENQQGNIKVRVELAKLYETSQRKTEALELVKEVLRLSNRETILRFNLPLPPPAAKPAVEPKSKAAKPTKPVAAPKASNLGGAAEQSTKRSEAVLVDDEDSSPPRMRRNSGVYKPIAPWPSDNAQASLGLTAVQARAARGSRRAASEEVEGPIQKRRRRHRAPLRPSHAATKDRIRRMQDEASIVRARFEVVNELWWVVENGEDESATQMWVEEARGLVDIFMMMDVFYPQRDKKEPFRGYAIRASSGVYSGRLMTEMQAMRSRLKESLHVDTLEGGEEYEDETSTEPPVDAPEDFHGISFSDWHHLFVDLALLYAHRLADRESCYVVTAGLRNANVFYHNPELRDVSMAASFCVAFVFNDSRLVNECARRYIVDSQFRSANAYQLMAAVSRMCFGNNHFSAGPAQKFMLRSLKQHDFALMEPTIRNRIDFSTQTRGLRNKLAGYARQKPPDFLPGLLLHYGHQTSESTQSFSALNYFHRVLALQPGNICVHLSIASAFIHNAMKRQTDNRHYGIHQGLAFLYRYYELRVASGNVGHVQEAEYNVSRAWQMLGLTHLAIPGYEKVLELSTAVRRAMKDGKGAGLDAEMVEDQEQQEETEDFAIEAAMALQGILAAAGNHTAARAVTEEWLVI